MFIQKYPYLNISIKVRAILAISIVPRGALVDSTYPLIGYGHYSDHTVKLWLLISIASLYRYHKIESRNEIYDT
jgi:hypothetical protein